MTMTVEMGGAVSALVQLGDDYSLRAIAGRVWRDVWGGALAAVDHAVASVIERNDTRARMTAGRRRMADEALRMAAVKAWALPPEAMAAAPAAPARGAMRLVDSHAVDSSLRISNAGEWQVASVVDGRRWEGQCQLSIMVEQARRAHFRRVGSLDGFVAPLTAGQVQMGQHYAKLVERHDAGGMKCTALGGRTGGSGSGGDFMDAFVMEGREIDAIRARIEAGQAMAVRRVRPSVRGTKLGITDRRLVDMVCLGGMDLTAVLEAHGWSDGTKLKAALRGALCAALDRMMGYR